jgi:hypothetical protein
VIEAADRLGWDQMVGSLVQPLDRQRQDQTDIDLAPSSGEEKYAHAAPVQNFLGFHS